MSVHEGTCLNARLPRTKEETTSIGNENPKCWGLKDSCFADCSVSGARNSREYATTGRQASDTRGRIGVGGKFN